MTVVHCFNLNASKFKKAFESITEAEDFAVMIKKNAGKLYPYSCPSCGLIHLSSSEPLFNKVNEDMDSEVRYWIGRVKEKKPPMKRTKL